MQEELKYAYAAGLIDGEGCIGMYFNSHQLTHQLRVTVEMTDKSGLEVLESIVPGKWYNRQRKGNRKPTYSWMVFNSKAAELLSKLQKYLVIKNKQAELVQLADWVSFIGKPLTETERNNRLKIAEAIKTLNQRGIYGNKAN